MKILIKILNAVRTHHPMSNISSRIRSLNSIGQQPTDDTLVVTMVKNLYGFRTGLLGYLCCCIAYSIPIQSRVFQRYLSEEVLTGDWDSIAYTLSHINNRVLKFSSTRWDSKKYLTSHGEFSMGTISMPRFYQNYYAQDSGKDIRTSMKPNSSGFIPWNIEPYSNNDGILWSVINSIGFVNVDIVDLDSIQWKIDIFSECIQQLQENGVSDILIVGTFNRFALLGWENKLYCVYRDLSTQQCVFSTTENFAHNGTHTIRTLYDDSMLSIDISAGYLPQNDRVSTPSSSGSSKDWLTI